MAGNIFSDEFLDQLSKRVAELIINYLPKDGTPKGQSDDDLITRQEAALMLNISPVTLYHWTKKGKIKSYSLGRRKYYKKSEILYSVTRSKSREEVRYV